MDTLSSGSREEGRGEKAERKMCEAEKKEEREAACEQEGRQERRQ